MSTRAICFIGRDPDVWGSLVELGRSQELSTQQYSSVEEFLNHRQTCDGCLVVDADSSAEAGLLIQRLRDVRCYQPAVLLIGHTTVPMAVGIMQSGAAGVLEKPCSSQSLSEAVRMALRKEQQQREPRQEHDELSMRLQRLTIAERDVMERMVQGKPNKQIAAELDIGLRTVELRRARVLEKMAAESLAGLVRMATVLELVRRWIL